MKGLLLFVLGGLCAMALLLLMPPQAATTVTVEPMAAVAETAVATAPAALSPPPPPVSVHESVASTASAITSPATDANSQAPVDAAPNPSSASAPELTIPVEGVRASALTDTFDDARAAGRIHDAIDIMAPKGTHVVAAADGKIVKLFTSVRGGLTVYEFDPSATFVYYYAHLDGYAPGLTEGMPLRRGDPIGFVGSSGDASPAAPHLHFEIGLLGPDKHWWQSTPVNPYPVLTGRQSFPIAPVHPDSASNTP